ncbi:MAG: hypothetical protein JNL01_00115 [Bdellovibrionales bacterium]|nr:hypothetical protein [Bdellovibrionales bacterium]
MTSRVDRLWPDLEWLGRRDGVQWMRVQWPEVRWVPSRVREIAQADPEKVVVTYSEQLFSKGSLLKGDYSRLISGLKSKSDARIIAALPSPLPGRIFKRETLDGVDAVIRFYPQAQGKLGQKPARPEFLLNLPADAGKPVAAGIPGTISRSGQVAPVSQETPNLRKHAESLFDFLKSSC